MVTKKRNSQEVAQQVLESPLVQEMFPSIGKIVNAASDSACCRKKRKKQKEKIRRIALYIDAMPEPKRNQLYKALSL